MTKAPRTDYTMRDLAYIAFGVQSEYGIIINPCGIQVYMKLRRKQASNSCLMDKKKTL